jgi:hypothetical protein
MRRLILIPILLSTLASACTPVKVDPVPAEPPTTIPLLPDTPVLNEPTSPLPALPVPKPGDSDLLRGPVFLDSAELLVLESFPPQYRLALKGSLPDPCHELGVEIPAPDAQGIIEVQVYSLAYPGKACIQVLESFETSVNLEGLTPGNYKVVVNGEPVGQIEVAARLDGHSMKGYELYAWQTDDHWVFSLLVGTNRVKSLDEVIDQAIMLKSKEALMGKLSKLPEGEFITLLPLPEKGDEVNIPAEILLEIQSTCEQHKLNCQFPVQ